jgi:hypothetical protein
VNTQKAAIISGKLAPFQGPITDQSGAVKVADGERMPDEDILGMNWLAAGVKGKLA